MGKGKITSSERQTISISTRVINLISRASSDEIARHGLLMVFLAVLSGFLMYLYQLAMGKLLSPQDFGILFSLTSILSIVTISAQALSATVSRFTSKMRAEGKTDSLGYLWRLFLRRAVVTGIIVFSLFVLLSPVISEFLHIHKVSYVVILFSSTTILFVFVANQGMLNGLQMFSQLGVSVALESFLVFVLAGVLANLGLGIYSALIAFPISYIAVAILSFYFLRHLRTARSEPTSVTGSGVYASYTLLSVLMFTAITN